MTWQRPALIKESLNSLSSKEPARIFRSNSRLHNGATEKFTMGHQQMMEPTCAVRSERKKTVVAIPLSSNWKLWHYVSPSELLQVMAEGLQW